MRMALLREDYLYPGYYVKLIERINGEWWTVKATRNYDYETANTIADRYTIIFGKKNDH